MNEVETIVMPRPFDWHFHARWDMRTTSALLPLLQQFGGALFEPNTKEKMILDGAAAIEEYSRFIYGKIDEVGQEHDLDVFGFKCWHAFYLTEETTPEVIDAAAWLIEVVKTYFRGSTTGSADGVRDLLASHLRPALDEIVRHEKWLSIHGEDIETEYPPDRVKNFLPKLMALCEAMPELKISLEHLSTEAELNCVRHLREQGINIVGTITLHHLMLTLADLMGSGLNPHYHCFPCLKTARDRDALREAAFGQESHFFFGSDSAPHIEANKLKVGGAGGIFTIPVVMPMLAELFRSSGFDNWRERLIAFTSIRGAACHGVFPSSQTLTLKRQPWTVPKHYGYIVPYMAGQTLPWSYI